MRASSDHLSTSQGYVVRCPKGLLDLTVPLSCALSVLPVLAGAHKCELLFLNLLNTSDCLWSRCLLPCVSPPGGICAPSAFTAQICHAFLGDSGSALTSLLLRLGCSHSGFCLAGVAARACKFPASFWISHAAFRAFYTKCQTPSGSLAGS